MEYKSNNIYLVEVTMIDINTYNGVIFDLDGTLIDSMGVWNQRPSAPACSLPPRTALPHGRPPHTGFSQS